MKSRLWILLPLLLLIPAGLSARSDADSRIGLTLDLLPTVLSAASGEAGYAAQIWLASERNRIRFVGSTLRLPDGMTGNAAFDQLHLTALACIIDHFFADDINGFWIGGGIELWLNDIRHTASGERLTWNDGVLTVGCGYIFPLSETFYLEPWAGLHWRLREPDIATTGGVRYAPARITAEASLKIGVKL